MLNNKPIINEYSKRMVMKKEGASTSVYERLYKRSPSNKEKLTTVNNKSSTKNIREKAKSCKRYKDDEIIANRNTLLYLSGMQSMLKKENIAKKAETSSIEKRRSQSFKPEIDPNSKNMVLLIDNLGYKKYRTL